MASIRESVFIAAPPEKVKEIFFDFSHHETWNPLFTKVECDSVPVKVGDKLKVELTINGSKQHMAPQIVENSDKCFSWKGTVGFDFIFNGVHKFEFISTVENGVSGTTFINSETFSGILLTVLNKFYDLIPNATKGFIDMNSALKKKVELE